MLGNELLLYFICEVQSESIKQSFKNLGNAYSQDAKDNQMDSHNSLVVPLIPAFRCKTRVFLVATIDLVFSLQLSHRFLEARREEIREVFSDFS